MEGQTAYVVMHHSNDGHSTTVGSYAERSRAEMARAALTHLAPDERYEVVKQVAEVSSLEAVKVSDEPDLT